MTLSSFLSATNPASWRPLDLVRAELAQCDGLDLLPEQCPRGRQSNPLDGDVVEGQLAIGNQRVEVGAHLARRVSDDERRVWRPAQSTREQRGDPLTLELCPG